MRVFSILILTLLLAGYAHSISATQPSTKLYYEDHLVQWQRIEYPVVSSPWPIFDMSLDVWGEPDALGFNINLGSSAKGATRSLPAPSDIQVFLHISGEPVVKAKGPDGRPGGEGNSFGMQWNYTYIFQWSKNNLKEAWIECRTPHKTFWLEIPYGLARDPNAPKTDDLSHPKGPVRTDAMKSMKPEDQIVPWLYVEYEIPVQNDWTAEVQVSNDKDPQVEVDIYKNDNVGQDGLLNWDLYHPTTSASYLMSNGDEYDCVCVKLQRDEYKRADCFTCGIIPSKDRCWATLKIGIDDRKFILSVPSSLFQWVHGHAGSGPPAI